MSEPRKILGEFISYEEKDFYGVNKYILNYKQPNSADPSKVWKHQAVEDNLSDEAIELLVGLSEGQRLCVHQNKDGNGYPIITSLSDAKDAPGKTTTGKSQDKSSSNWTPKDDTGIVVGAAWTNAIEVLKLGNYEAGEPEDTIKYLAELVEKIIALKLAQEDRLRASKTAKIEVTNKVAEEVKSKPKSRAELAKEKKTASAKPQSEEDKVVKPDSTDDLDKVNFE